MLPSESTTRTPNKKAPTAARAAGRSHQPVSGDRPAMARSAGLIAFASTMRDRGIVAGDSSHGRAAAQRLQHPPDGHEGYTRRADSTPHVAADAVGHPLALRVPRPTPRNREQTGGLAAVQDAAGRTSRSRSSLRGSTNAAVGRRGGAHGIALESVGRPGFRPGFALLRPRGARFRPLGRRRRTPAGSRGCPAIRRPHPPDARRARCRRRQTPITR